MRKLVASVVYLERLKKVNMMTAETLALRNYSESYYNYKIKCKLEEIRALLHHRSRQMELI